MNKQILSGPDALNALLRGTNLIADAVKSSLGPSGRNTIYERQQTNQPVSTRDGVTIAEQIAANDPFENIAVETIKGVAREAVDQSGDGTTTATLLAQAIFAEGVKAITVGANPVALKRGIERATTNVVAQLKEMARSISGDSIRQVATISANNDEALGNLIAEAMKRAGDDGVVTVEISRTPESSLHVVDGMQVGTGWIHSAFVNSPEKQECVLEDCYILLWERKLATIIPFLKKMEPALLKEGKSLLVIAEDVTDEALGILTANAAKRVPLCAIRTPGAVDHLHDIAALTRGTVFTEVKGVKLQDVSIENLGHAAKVVVKPQSTTIIADPGANPALDRRLSELRAQVTDATDEGSRLRLQSRLARLVGGVAVIRVGAKTELEMLERKDRIEDAMHATRCAMKEGVLPGGGIALLRAAQSLDPSKVDGEGVEIIRRACEAPLRTLAQNCGESADYVIKSVTSTDRGVPSTYGWNARTGEFGDMFEMGILDPLRVVRVALESAASVAALMLITSTLVANDRPKRD
jgi:chaperonin GroEL